MKLFSAFLFQLLTWLLVQGTSIAQLSADEALTLHDTPAAGVVFKPQPRW